MFNTKIFENNPSTGSNPTPSINIPNSNNTGDNAQPIDISYHRSSIFNNSRFRRESLAHSQGMGGVSWGSITIGSWLKDEVMMFSNQNQPPAVNNPQGLTQQSHHIPPNGLNIINPRRGSFRFNNMNSGAHSNNPAGNHGNMHHNSMALSPPQTSYLPNLEADYCKDYSCCGQLLPTLHDLLRHYEEAHINLSPPTDNANFINSQRNRNLNNIHNILETVSTTDVFLNNNPHLQQQQAQLQAQQQAQQEAQQRAQEEEEQAHLQAQQQAQQEAQQQHVKQQAHQRQLNNQQSPRHQQQSQFGQGAQQLQQHTPQTPQQFSQSPSEQENGGSPMEEDDLMYIDDPARHLYVMENNEDKPFKCPVIGCDEL